MRINEYVYIFHVHEFVKDHLGLHRFSGVRLELNSNDGLLF